VLRAARIRFDTRAGTVSATGGVEATDLDLSVRADTVEFRMADEHVLAAGGVRVRLVRDGEATVLSAPQAEGWLRSRRFSARGGVSVERGEWTVSGRTLDYDDGTGAAVTSGDPVARLGQVTVTARVITFLTAEEVARAEGAVVLRRGDVVGSAPRAEVFGREGRAVLSGGAAVERGRDRVTAEVIEIALDGSRVAARGASRLVIMPP
jgi:lipopolysaccharide export system protein LptA